MPPFRNLFAKRPTGFDPTQDENIQHGQNGTPGFERADTVGSKSSSAMSISSRQSQEPAEYKLSVVNDSGVYLPPSPPEKKGFWPRRGNHPDKPKATNALAEIEAFSISRESFDSYRRSFDISAKSPVIADTTFGRQSLDSARLPRLPRSAIGERRFEKQPPTAEEGFEEVGLNDEQKQLPKKKGFFSRMGDGEGREQSPSSRFHITGRKRGQSGQGAELGNIDRPTTATSSIKETTD